MARPEGFQIRVTDTQNLGDRLVVTFQTDIDPPTLMRALEASLRIAPEQPHPSKLMDLFKGLPLIRRIVRDQLADYAHHAWSGWMEYMFSKCYKRDNGEYVIPREYVARWTRQMTTAYKDLPANEQASDLVEADRMLLIVERFGVPAEKFALDGPPREG